MPPPLKMTKKEIYASYKKYQALFIAATEQLTEVDWAKSELETYKDYLKDSRERLQKVRKERDLALELLALRLTPHT
jgi:hypothetical protein